MLTISTFLWAWLAQATFSTRTEAVVLPVRVVDSRGHAVTGLRQDSFRVYDEGRLQAIASFAAGSIPITLGLAVDYSVSMRSQLPAILSAVDAFTRTAQPDDQLFAVWFNDTVPSPPPAASLFTSNPAVIADTLSQARAFGATALYDGVIEGLDRLRWGTRERKALIVISDGGDNASRHTLETLIASARRANAVVYAVGLVDAPRDRRAEKILERIATESGGAAYFASSASEVGPLLARIGSDLRDQYTLGFVPDRRAGGKTVRRLEVKVSAPGIGRVTVRTRASYALDAGDR